MDEDRVKEHKEEMAEEPEVEGHIDRPEQKEYKEYKEHQEEPDVEGHVLERPEHTEMNE